MNLGDTNIPFLTPVKALLGKGAVSEALRVLVRCGIPVSPEEAGPVRLVLQLESQIMKSNTF